MALFSGTSTPFAYTAQFLQISAEIINEYFLRCGILTAICELGDHYDRCCNNTSHGVVMQGIYAVQSSRNALHSCRADRRLLTALQLPVFTDVMRW